MFHPNYTLNIIFARALSRRFITVVKRTGLCSISITLTRETTFFIADVIVVMLTNGAIAKSNVYIGLAHTGAASRLVCTVNDSVTATPAVLAAFC